jgi:nucleoside-diphosphate-sugar epimerase
MTVLITGINGFIASHLYNILKNEHTVIGTTREDSANIIEILNKHKPEYIYHIGAEIYDNDKMFDSNIMLTFHILEYCRTANKLVKLIIIGSSSEYGRKSKPMSENDVLEPQTIYEGTKAACSMLAQSYSNTYNIPILIIRPFTIYGPGEKPNKFLQILFKKLKNNDKTIAISKGVHDYVYIEDFINALLAIVYNNTNLFDIINIGSGIQTPNIDVVKCFEKITQYKFDNYLSLEPKKYDSDTWVCDNTKLHKYYTIKYSLEIGIEEMYKLYKQI